MKEKDCFKIMKYAASRNILTSRPVERFFDPGPADHIYNCIKLLL